MGKQNVITVKEYWNIKNPGQLQTLHSNQVKFFAGAKVRPVVINTLQHKQPKLQWLKLQLQKQ